MIGILLQMALQLIDGHHVHPILEFSKLSKSSLYDLVSLLENSNFFHLHSHLSEHHNAEKKLTLVVKLDDLRSLRHSLEVDKDNIPPQVEELFQFVRNLFKDKVNTQKPLHEKIKKVKHVHFHNDDECEHDHDDDEECNERKSNFCCIL